MTMRWMATAAMLGVLMAPAGAAEAPQDSLAVTAACDANASAETTNKLMDWVQDYFARFKKIRPIKDRMSKEPFAEPDGDLIEYHDAVFRDFQARYIRESGGGRTLETLSTRSPSVKLPWGLALGQSMRQVRAILGPPSAIGPRALQYQNYAEAAREVLFTFDHDRLVEVRWYQGQAD